MNPSKQAEATSVPPSTPAAPTPPDLISEDLLVEDVSIDDMCGVYSPR
jgi:mycofactocin precursor